MTVHPEILTWVKNLGIRSVLNAPCGLCQDCRYFVEAGVKKIIGINILPIPPGMSDHIQADLCNWRPDESWDAAYVNCFFCSTNQSKTGTHEQAARNIASWPVRFIVVYDTILLNDGFEWRTIFHDAGWRAASFKTTEKGKFHTTRLEIWEHAA